MSEMEWRDDPTLPGRKRGWDGRWLKWVADSGETYEEPYLGDHPRWQYGVVALGSFNAFERIQETLQFLGSGGWELVTIYDKASNWIAGYEKGFMLFKRPVPAGERLDDDEWCVAVNLAG